MLHNKDRNLRVILSHNNNNNVVLDCGVCNKCKRESALTLNSYRHFLSDILSVNFYRKGWTEENNSVHIILWQQKFSISLLGEKALNRKTTSTGIIYIILSNIIITKNNALSQSSLAYWKAQPLIYEHRTGSFCVMITIVSNLDKDCPNISLHNISQRYSLCTTFLCTKIIGIAANLNHTESYIPFIIV